MAMTPMSPGTVLDGRYLLEVLLSEHDGARFWRATDTVLARSVAVHVVSSEDPRAPKVLAAARSSAAVTDPHFLRVLDCEDVNGLTWVINEWGEGVSLDVLLAKGTLPPMRAAWLTREVAEAMVAAHAQGLCHGRLNPEAVLVTESGSVKLIGFLVNAAFERQRPQQTGAPPTAPYGAVSAREADVIDLAGILYAALTGKWPGVSPSAVPPAPREGSRPLRPRQVRAGVPRTLDAICDRVLHKEAFQHSMPIETALEIAAALSDFVGDPTLVAPIDAPSMHEEPEPPAPVDLGETAVGYPIPFSLDEARAMPEPTAPPAPPPSAPAVTPAPVPVVVDAEATMAAPPPYEPADFDYLEHERWEPATPPPPFEQPDERPLFAEQERRVPVTAPVSSPTDPGAPPIDAPAAGTRRRPVWRILLFILVILGVSVSMYLAFVAGKGKTPAPTTPAPTTTATTGPTGSNAPSTSPTPVLSGTPVPIAAAGDFDPEGNPPGENPGRVRLAIDGDPTTAWPTSYYSGATFGEKVSGVGIVVDLGHQTSVTSIQVQLIGTPTDVEFYATPPGDRRPPSLLADATRVGRVVGAGTTAAATVSVRTRYLIVWLTKLPADGAPFRGQVAEITVRS